jgi:CheY-like chemotaxis protein
MHNDPVILYVEDDLQSRRVMNLLLVADMGLSNVTIFENSEDFMARVLALDLKPDLIFLDIHVRPCSGFEMLAMLRSDEAFHDVPVVALTASVMNEEVINLRTAGFNGVVAKPIKIEAFPGIMERVLNGDEVWQVIG